MYRHEVKEFMCLYWSSKLPLGTTSLLHSYPPFRLTLELPVCGSWHARTGGGRRTRTGKTRTSTRTNRNPPPPSYVRVRPRPRPFVRSLSIKWINWRETEREMRVSQLRHLTWTVALLCAWSSRPVRWRRAETVGEVLNRNIGLSLKDRKICFMLLGCYLERTGTSELLYSSTLPVRRMLSILMFLGSAILDIYVLRWPLFCFHNMQSHAGNMGTLREGGRRKNN